MSVFCEKKRPEHKMVRFNLHMVKLWFKLQSGRFFNKKYEFKHIL